MPAGLRRHLVGKTCYMMSLKYTLCQYVDDHVDIFLS